MIGRTISHYKIIDKIGEGGMGVVYKAEDMKLKRTVALKFLPHDALAGDDARARFTYEAQAAAALDHPNICTVYEIDEADGQTFIAMALVEGLNLREKVAVGPLRIDEALDIAVQVAEGLHEAHEKGIVHRDIKPSNLMVSTSGQARIMDFGLARSAEQTKITKTGTTLGTVAYMSPEQARGAEVDSRTDIWSFGVMIYEMVTGRLPFKGANEQALLYSVLNDEPEPMTGLRTGVPVELERIVTKAMAKRVDERYQHVDEMLVDLRALRKNVGAETTPVPTQPLVSGTAARTKGHLSFLLPLGIAVVAVVAAFLSTKLLRRGPEIYPDRVVVAVFENRTGDESLDPIGHMAADWITQGLSQTDEVEVVPSMTGQQFLQAVGEGLQEIDQLRGLAKATGAGVVVSGAYYLEGENLQFQTKVTNAVEGKLLYALQAIRGPRTAPLEIIKNLQEQVMGALASHFGHSNIARMGAQPPVFEAYREHLLGMWAFGVDYEQAMHHFERAAELDSTYLSPRIFLVYSYSNQGRIAEADSLLRLLKRGGPRITPYQRLYIDMTEALLHNNHAECMRFLRELEKKTPYARDINYLIGLAAIRLNRPGEAADAYASYEGPTVVPTHRYTIGWWKASYWADAMYMLGKHREELEIVRQGRERYPDIGWLRIDEIRALVALGRIDEARRLIDECASSSESFSFQCRVLTYAVRALRIHGHADVVPELSDRADALYTDLLDNEDATEGQCAAAGEMLYSMERWEEARSLYAGLAAEHPDDLNYMGAMGCLEARRGNREEALEIDAELGRIDRPYLFGDNTYWRACIAAQLGEQERAVELLREAFAQGQAYGAWMYSDTDLEPLRDYPPFKELMRPKG